MNEEQRRAVGEQIKSARQLRGWNQKQLAEAAGISPNTVGALERGENGQPGKLAQAMAALGIEPLAETQERVGYPVDVELIRDAIGMWLLDMPEDERASAVRQLLRAITAG